MTNKSSVFFHFLIQCAVIAPRYFGVIVFFMIFAQAVGNSMVPVVNSIFAAVAAGIGGDYWTVRLSFDLVDTMVLYFFMSMLAFKASGVNVWVAAIPVGLLEAISNLEDWHFDLAAIALNSHHAWHAYSSILTGLTGALSFCIYSIYRKKNTVVSDGTRIQVTLARKLLRSAGIGILFIGFLIGFIYAYMVFCGSEYERLQKITDEILGGVPLNQARTLLNNHLFLDIEEQKKLDTTVFQAGARFVIKSRFFLGAMHCAVYFDGRETRNEFSCRNDGVMGLIVE